MQKKMTTTTMMKTTTTTNLLRVMNPRAKANRRARKTVNPTAALTIKRTKKIRTSGLKNVERKQRRTELLITSELLWFVCWATSTLAKPRFSINWGEQMCKMAKRVVLPSKLAPQMSPSTQLKIPWNTSKAYVTFLIWHPSWNILENIIVPLICAQTTHGCFFPVRWHGIQNTRTFDHRHTRSRVFQ